MVYKNRTACLLICLVFEIKTAKLNRSCANFLSGFLTLYIVLSKRTIIGFIVGSVIIGIGVASLLQHVGTLVIDEDHVIGQGSAEIYKIPAPQGTSQSMTIAGDAFDVTLSSPGDGLQIPETKYKEKAELEWVHAEDGETTIRIHNTGKSELQVTGTLIRSADPIWFTYDIMVIISGMVIIGFSMGFTLRRPKGF